ncbi:MAG: acyl-homoserine-lactone synthase [Pseudomonadota bacterium]
MLRYLTAQELAQHPRLERTMFEDRATQFATRLGWDVTVEDGQERDAYDAMNPLYVIWQAPDGSHGGSMRVMPTTAPCMVNDHFAHLTGGPIMSPLIWESTRFCLSPRLGAKAGAVSAAIMLGGCEIGMNYGLRHAVGVFDGRMVRIYRALGWAPEIVGETGTGRERIAVGLWEFDAATRYRLADRAGVSPALSELWFRRALDMAAAPGLAKAG